MSRLRAGLVPGLCCLLFVACYAPVWPPIRAWLSCDECSEGELEAVVAVGKHAIGPLAAALRDGPSARQIQNVRTRVSSDVEAAKRFRQLVIQGSPDIAGPAAIDAASFTDDQVRAYIDLFRERGLIGLSAIGTPAARDSIHQMRLRDASAPFGWSATIRARVLQHDEGVTDLRIIGPDSVGLGQSAQAQVQTEGFLQNPPLVWSTNSASVTVSASGELTGIAPGFGVVRACWIAPNAPAASLCASRAVQVTP